MKSPLKTILISSLVTFSAFISIVYTSCNNDKCKSIVCAYGGVFNQGACTCQPGFEGSNCETISSTKFIGGWQVSETGTTTAFAQYEMAIEVDTPVTTVFLKNLNNYFTDLVIAYVNHDTLTIPNQDLDGKTVFGTGYIYSTDVNGNFGIISMRYEVIDDVTNRADDFGVYPDGSSPSIWILTH